MPETENKISIIKDKDNFKLLSHYKEEVDDELKSILNWWMKHFVDDERGGFYASVNNKNIPDFKSPKGIVLNSRILWTFSAAFKKNADPSYLAIATRAFEYIINHFIDYEYGGVFWSVDQHGKMLDGRKQMYGLAFCIYGMAEYYKVSNESEALTIAEELFELIEKYSLDSEKGGYIEAFSRDWTEINDLRLSEKDDNEKKTMNTHLHIIEAYANLYMVKPTKLVKGKIASLLELFSEHIIDKKTHHLHLFMNEDWELQSFLISYGHDIEAAWLLQECAAITGYSICKVNYTELAIKIADAAAEGLDSDGGMWYEFDPGAKKLIKEKHSWPQAEAMIGFFNAYQITKDSKYLKHSLQSWNFVKKNICDKENGEWFWGINADGTIMDKEKAGFWKCPYHSARACMEIIKRIDSIN